MKEDTENRIKEPAGKGYSGGSKRAADIRTDFVKHTVRDSVFSDLFSDKKYLLRLYKSLHPEDDTVTTEDLTDVTIRNVLVNELYNDLGFMVRGRLMILCECQSLWTVNIIIRALLYMARSLHEYLKESDTDLYGKRKANIPRPEIYVIYIGDKKDTPEMISLAKEFFAGEETAVDVRVKVISEESSTDIINEYIVFCKVYGEQLKKYKRTRKAITETIRICRDRNILREYLKSREKEVTDIMMTLFDEDEIYEMHFNSLKKEFLEEGREEERANTERERQRADNAEARADDAEAELSRYKEKFGVL